FILADGPFGILVLGPFRPLTAVAVFRVAVFGVAVFGVAVFGVAVFGVAALRFLVPTPSTGTGRFALVGLVLRGLVASPTGPLEKLPPGILQPAGGLCGAFGSIVGHLCGAFGSTVGDVAHIGNSLRALFQCVRYTVHLSFQRRLDGLLPGGEKWTPDLAAQPGEFRPVGESPHSVAEQVSRPIVVAGQPQGHLDRQPAFLRPAEHVTTDDCAGNLHPVVHAMTLPSWSSPDLQPEVSPPRRWPGHW